MFNTEALRRFGDGKAGDVSGACRWAADEINRLTAALETIANIGEGSTTANSLPHMARIARAALTSGERGD